MNIIFKLIFRFCATAIIILAYFQIAVADDVSNKYQNIFYPNGMPMVVGTDGVSRPMGYEFYCEDPLPNSNLNVILFSEIIKKGELFEDIYITHNVHVAIVQDNKKILSKTSASIKNGLPDSFVLMGGVLNHFKISSTIQAEHLYLWGVIAGSGQEEHGTNYIYRIDRTNNTLIPILELDDSFFYDQAGLGEITSKMTYLYIADIDNDGKMEILTRNYSDNVEDNVESSSWSDIINVYHYNDATSKYEPAGTISALPANAVELSITNEERGKKK